jgi:hypothetical protein
MARALLRQVANYNRARRKLAEMEPAVIGGSDSAGHLGPKRQRDRALHHIKCFAFNFKEGNFLDFNPGVSGLTSDKVVSANTNKRKSDAISPPGTSGLQVAGLPLIRRQPPIALGLQAQQQQQQQQQQQLMLNQWNMGGG